MLELIRRREFFFAANLFNQLELSAMPVDVAIEIENVRLNRARRLIEGRSHPDVGDRGIVPVIEDHAGRIHAVWRKAFGFAFEIRSGKSDGAAALAPTDHRAVQKMIAPE